MDPFYVFRGLIVNKTLIKKLVLIRDGCFKVGINDDGGCLTIIIRRLNLIGSLVLMR